MSLKFRTLFFKLFLSYTLFLFVPVVTFYSLFQFNLLEYVEQQVSSSNMGRLSQTQRSIEAMIQNLSRDALRVCASSSVRELGKITLDNYNQDTTNIFIVRAMYETLWSLESVNEGIHSVYLYNEDKHYIVSSKGEFASEASFADSEWIEEYLKNKDRMLILKPRWPKNGRSSDPSAASGRVISLVYPIPQLSANITGAIVINISVDSFQQYAGKSKYDRPGSIFIIDREGHAVIGGEDKQSTGSDMKNEAYVSEILNSPENEAYFTAQINGLYFVVTYIKSDANDWIYVDLIPMDSLYSRVSQIKIVIVIISLLLISMGILFSYLLSGRIYKPVKGILETLRAKSIIGRENGKNELSVLSGVLDKLIKDEELLNEEIEQYQRSLKQTYLTKLIKGELDDKEKIGMFPNHYFCCILFSIDRYAAFIENHNQEELKYLMYILLCFCEEVVGKFIKCSGVLIESDKICIIMNTESSAESTLRKVVENIYAGMQGEVPGLNGISFSLSVGKIYEGMDNIRCSYMEAAEAMQYRLLLGCGSLIFYWSVEERRGEYYYPASQTKQIQNCLMVNSYEGVRAAFEELIDHIEKKEDLSYENLMHILYQLLGEIANYSLSCNLKLSEIFDGESALFKTLDRFETLRDIKEWMLNLYDKVIRYREESENRNKKYIKEIVAAIHENYKKSDLDINFIASKVNLSYSYFRKIFKENMNCSFLDYVNNLRVSEAKQLLKNTNWTTEKIAEHVGFYNYQAFGRVFKKNEGVTPGRYREISDKA